MGMKTDLALDIEMIDAIEVLVEIIDHDLVADQEDKEEGHIPEIGGDSILVLPKEGSTDHIHLKGKDDQDAKDLHQSRIPGQNQDLGLSEKRVDLGIEVIIDHHREKEKNLLNDQLKNQEVGQIKNQVHLKEIKV